MGVGISMPGSERLSEVDGAAKSAREEPSCPHGTARLRIEMNSDGNYGA